MKTLIRGATLIDGTGAKPRENAAVAIAEGRIVAIGTVGDFGSAWSGAGVETVDAAGQWIIPGLINMHDHLALRDLVGNPENEMRIGPSKLYLNAIRNAITALRRGWTTVRDMGSPGALGLDIRNLVAGGHMPGPRVLSCGHPICVSGGHAWGMSIEADGADAVRSQARLLYKRGADFTKVMASDDPYPVPGPAKTTPQYTPAELAAAADEAHRRGRHAACHVMGEQAIADVLDAGFDVLSHGGFLTPRLAERMAARGTYLDPTLSGYGVQTVNPKRGRGEAWIAAHRPLVEPVRSGFQAAIAAGVRIVVGTDTSGIYAEDVALMRELGLGAMESLVAATRNGADALGLGDDIGTVEAGKAADLVVLDADPLADARNLETVALVIKAGTLLRPADIVLDDRDFLACVGR
jgi:imidazolonepropionase-like amidohydrolase